MPNVAFPEILLGPTNGRFIENSLNFSRSVRLSMIIHYLIKSYCTQKLSSSTIKKKTNNPEAQRNDYLPRFIQHVKLQLFQVQCSFSST